MLELSRAAVLGPAKPCQGNVYPVPLACRLAYWPQLPSISFPELQCLRDGTPYQLAAAPATAAGAAAAGQPLPAAAQQQQQEGGAPAIELSLQEDGSLAARSSPQLHHPLSGEPVQLRLPLDSAASFSTDRLLLQAAAHSAAVQLAAVQAALQHGGRLPACGVLAELVLTPSSLEAAAAAADAPLPTSPLLQLWSGSSLQLSLSVQLRTGRLLLAAGPLLLESEQGSAAAAAVAGVQQQLDQAQRSALVQPLATGTSRGMLAARLVADAVARLSLQLGMRRRMDAAVAAAAALGLHRAALPQRLLQQYQQRAALLLGPLSSNTLTLALPAYPQPCDLGKWCRQQAQQRQAQPGALADSGATRCFVFLDFGEGTAVAAQPVNHERGASNGMNGVAWPVHPRVLLAVCACTSRGTATRVLQLAELPPALLQGMQPAADGAAGGSTAASRKRRASDAAMAEAEAQPAAAGDEPELSLAAAVAWCKRQASWAALRAQLQLLPAQHAEEVSFAQPHQPASRLPKLPVLTQLDPWAAAQLAASGDALVCSGGDTLAGAPGTPTASADGPAPLLPAKPVATMRLEEGDGEAEAGRWRVDLSSLYFAHLRQLLAAQGVALAPPAADAQHVATTEAGLALHYSLQKGAGTADGTRPARQWA